MRERGRVGRVVGVGEGQGSVRERVLVGREEWQGWGRNFVTDKCIL